MKRKAIPAKDKRFVMERDEHKCTRCGATEELIIHHETPVSEGGGNEPENLKVLCMACHKAVHLERGDDYAADMASTRNGWVRGEPNYSYKQVELSAATKALRDTFEVSTEEAEIIRVLYGWYEGYPNLLNIAKEALQEELEVAKVVTSLIDREFILVSRAPGRSNFYRVDRKRYDDYFGMKTIYLDDDDNVVAVTRRGHFWIERSEASA